MALKPAPKTTGTNSGRGEPVVTKEQVKGKKPWEGLKYTQENPGKGKG